MTDILNLMVHCQLSASAGLTPGAQPQVFTQLAATQHLSHHLPPPPCTDRKLDQKWSIRNSNWAVSVPRCCSLTHCNTAPCSVALEELHFSTPLRMHAGSTLGVGRSGCRVTSRAAWGWVAPRHSSKVGMEEKLQAAGLLQGWKAAVVGPQDI